MTPILRNRDFARPAGDWFPIETPGTHENTATGIIQIIDGPAVESIVNRFNQEARDYSTRTGRPYPGMLIDREHFRHDPKKETRAYGWLMAMENRNGVPFGEIKWTATGQKAVDGGDYRYFSTEYSPDDLVVLNSGKPQRVRPMRLDGLSLTNQPNNVGGLPITNRSISWPPVEIPHDHNFDSDEEYIAMVRKNQQLIEANRVNQEKAEQEKTKADQARMAMQAREASELARPHLEKWFRAIRGINEMAVVNGARPFDFQTAWDMAQHQYPDLYANAFNNPEVSIITAADPNTARHVVGTIANRIRGVTRWDFLHSWRFVERELPVLFNRMTPFSQRIANRAQDQTPAIVQLKARQLFQRLVRDEEISSGMPFSQAWLKTRNSEAVLAQLADGTIPLAQAYFLEPDLRQRLK